jgi:hypothetical protein
MNTADGVNLLRHLACHFVSLNCIQQIPESDGSWKINAFEVSGFVLSVRGIWSIVTAGHVFSQIAEAKKAGHEFRDWLLDDSWGIDSEKQPPIPFDFEGADQYSIDKPGLDYGLIGIRQYYGSMLANNGVRALGENHWKEDFPPEFDHYAILGMPAELQEHTVSDGGILCGHNLVLLWVEREDSPPAEVLKPYPCFYGRLAPDLTSEGDDIPLRSINGMSGGPIFGLYTDADGKSGYKLVAVQSSWFPEKRIVVGCRMDQLGNALDKHIAELQQSQQ